MKTMNLILGCLILAAILMPLAACLLRGSPHLRSIRALQRAFGFTGPNVRVNALTDGTHKDGRLGHLLADAAHTLRYLLVKTGSDAGHFALNGAGDKPLGICLDTPAAAEDPASVALFGAVGGTVLMVGSEAISAGDDVYTAAGGKVQNEPATAGTYYRVGRAVTACTGDGLQFEVVPCLPQLTKVIANASTLAQTQAAMVNGAVVIVLGA